MSSRLARALDWRWTPWLFNLSVALVARGVLPVDLADRGERYAYHAMSRAFPLPQCATFHCFRFLPPLFASLPPFEVIDAFLVTGVVFQTLAGVVLWHLTTRLSGSRRIALLTTAWYWATWAPILSLTDPLLITDPVQAFWCFACLYLLLAEHDALALTMLVAGAAVKESVLLVPMTYGVYVLLTRPRSAWRLARLSVLAAAPIVTWLGVRAYLHAYHSYSVAGDSSYLRGTYFFGVWLKGLAPWPLNLRYAALYIFGTFGAGWILGVLGLARTNGNERAVAAGAAPAMLFLALYQVPDRALATFPYAVLIPAARYTSLLPAPLVAMLLIVNAAFTLRMNAASRWLPPSSVLLGVLVALLAIGAWMIRRATRGGGDPDAQARPDVTRSLPADTSDVRRASLVALAVGAALVAVFAWRASTAPPPERLVPPDAVSIADDDAATPGLALSRDGRQLAFIGGDRAGARRLWLRNLDSPAATVLDGADDPSAPFWSPEGDRIAFFAHGKLRTIDIRTRQVVDVADAPVPRGGTWGDEDVIVFAPAADAGLYRVPAQGGTPVAVTTLDVSARQMSHRWPSFLPDGRRFVFSATGSREEDRAIFLGSLASTAAVRLIDHACNAVYADGYLIYAVPGGLLARPFDLRREHVFGPAMIAAGEVAVSSELDRGAFTVAMSTMVVATTSAQWQLKAAATQGLWVDRMGRPAPRQPPPPPEPTGQTAEVSPDGKWVAYTSKESGRPEVFVRANPPDGRTWRISTEGGLHPHWNADGGELFFVMGDRLLASAQIDAGAGFHARAPRYLFAVDFPPGDSTHAVSDFAVSADGQQIFVQPIVGQQPSAPAFVIGSWRNRLILP